MATIWEASSKLTTTWTPDEYGSFNFSGNKCDNIKATGMIKYGSIYKHLRAYRKLCFSHAHRIGR